MNRNVKIAIIVVALLAAAVLAWKNLQTTNAIPSTANFVCVVTGKTYTIDKKDLISIPAKNPDTGEATLLPLKLDSVGGKQEVDPHYREFLDQLQKVNKYVDPSTLEVRNQPQ